jgi:hypothetical protein
LLLLLLLLLLRLLLHHMTGENWEEVELQLSTASPSSQLNPPEVENQGVCVRACAVLLCVGVSTV